MKLALVAIHIEPSPRALPLGPAMLASVLRGAFGEVIQTRVVDAFVTEPAAACAARILASDPDLVGFSMYVWNRSQTLEIAARLKANRPDIVIFAGGAEATADVAGVLADPSMDFVLPGEGEEILVEAMGRLLQGDPPRALAEWARPRPVKDLTDLPSPYLDGTLRPEDYGGALWELSRGCPFTCDFCFEARGTAGTRRIPLARVEAELDLFEARGIREVFVLDPTFNYHKVQAKQVLRLIAAKAPGTHFFFEVRSEFLDREMAGLFAAIRCTLQIGLQSAHDDVLRNISRSFDPEDFEAKILLLHQAGVPYGFDLIYGLPGDTLEGFRESVDFAMGLVPNHLDVFRLSVLPGTRLAETAAGLQLRHEAHNPYRVLSSPSFSAADMDQAGRIAKGCDALYNQGRAVPWFGMLLEPLELRPSEVFEAFAAWLEAHPEAAPIETQRGFFRSLFEARGDRLLGDLAADVIACFSYSSALMDEPSDEAAAVRRVSFHHDPRALMAQIEEGTTRLEELAFSVEAMPCEVEFALVDGELILRVQ
ncbi:MAG: radical SAM protein [Geothrix sp.]|uniref:B12-binding domain-containing radical SAM protein n=1 Tax=Geothrix sp. TaxID=1962974 RepID=UPI0017B3C332|nr:B12-binding domain-containing radical SAM protein [Geothrix sp.]NWJ42214.1 radical SAM protein [Geothrix sp.]WIL19823.1 MAG: radical SAM protein [Geothrix sp.]